MYRVFILNIPRIVGVDGTAEAVEPVVAIVQAA